MKKRILLIVAVLSIGFSSVMANGRGEINEKALTSFQKDFSNATQVNWEANSRFLKVSFTLNEQVLTAYYSEEGERLATVRNLRSYDLPMGLLEELKQTYSNYWITELFEFHGKDDNAYYVTIENADYKITLKSIGTYQWINFKKSEKR